MMIRKGELVRIGKASFNVLWSHSPWGPGKSAVPQSTR